MAKRPEVSNVTVGFNSTASLNASLNNIRDAFSNTLSRDGSGPNELNTNLDMNGYRIINAGAGTDPNDLARIGDIGEVAKDAAESIAVRHDTAQTLSNSAKAQARQNIGAPSSVDLSDAVADLTDLIEGVVHNGIRNGQTSTSPSEDAVFDALALKATPADITAAVGDIVKDSIRNGETLTAPSENAVFDALAGKADTSALSGIVHNGIRNGETLTAPSEDAVFDALAGKANTSALTGLVYDGIRDGTTTSAPSENAVFDALQKKLTVPLKGRLRTYNNRDVFTLEGRSIRIKRNTQTSVASGVPTAIILDTTLHNDAGFTASAGVVYIPEHLSGAMIQITAYASFTANATGIRQLAVWKNSAPFVGGAAVMLPGDALFQTELTAVTSTFRAVADDFFSIVVTQTSGTALNVPHTTSSPYEVWMEIKVVRDPPMVRNANGFIRQGDYNLNLGTQLPPTTGVQFGQLMAFASVCVLSHPPFTVDDSLFPVDTQSGTPPPFNGCVDGVYPGWADAVREYRRIRPDGIIFGYVSPASDAPAGSTCGYALKGGASNGNPPFWGGTNTQIPNVIAWLDAWAALPTDIRPDGIFFDIVAPWENGGWITADVRDKCYAAAKARGFRIMSNTTNPSYVNAAFAASGLSQGDFVYLEGFCLVNGISSEVESIACMEELKKYRHLGVKAFLHSSTLWNLTPPYNVTPPTPQQAETTRRLFYKLADDGDVVYFGGAALGLDGQGEYGPILPFF